jgi:hypothetical protein
VKLTIYYILHFFFNLTNMMMLFIGSSCVFPTTILLIYKRLQHCNLGVLVCNTPICFFSIENIFLFNMCKKWKFILALTLCCFVCASWFTCMQICFHHHHELYAFHVIDEFHKFIRFVIRTCKNICNNEKKMIYEMFLSN